MSNNESLNCIEGPFNKFIIEEKGDKNYSTENSSKTCENCRLIKDELEAEIFALKDKNHQSFMQVIQVQQLHEEEMEMLRLEHQESILSLHEEIKRLTAIITKNQEDLLTMEKNSKHYICEVEQPSFIIDNIELIECEEDNNNQKANLDESSFDQFKELVQVKNTPINSHLSRPKLFEEKDISEKNETEEKIIKLNRRINELENEVQYQIESNQELKKECSKIMNNEKSIKNNYDSLYKESKFMADHIRNLANDKFKLEKKVKEFEKSFKCSKNSSINDNTSAISSICINPSSSRLFNDEYFDMTDSIVLDKEHNKIDPIRLSVPPNPQPIKYVNKLKSISKGMAKLSTLTLNNEMDFRKSMPNVKKAIQLSSSFRKTSVDYKTLENKSELIKVEKEITKEKFEKSDSMDEIQKEIELKAKKKHQPTQNREERMRMLTFYQIKNRSKFN